MRFDGQTEEAYTYEYGTNGRVMRLTDTVLQRVTESEYDLAERPMRIRHRTASGTHLYTGEVTYNGYNELSAFREKVGTSGSYETAFTYDNESKPTVITYGDTAHDEGLNHRGRDHHSFHVFHQEQGWEACPGNAPDQEGKPVVS